ncbi:MAG: type IV toxin-antitoxin system AbiEi family antitoxin domain-containing protein [Actinomycetota bacterium]|nr:type IV toxin-antitoxin system AbiEi family antitoxin domain-containing protein [Actinomycetota bacterium]
MDPDRIALDIASRQGGVLTRGQAIDCGISAPSIKYRLRRRRWTKISRSVYRLIELDQPSDLLRAAITVLPNSVISHQSAAEFHEIQRVQRGLATVTVHTRTTHSFPAVEVHRSHDLRTEHTRVFNGLPYTTLPRTVVDLAGILRPKHIERIADDLITEKRLTVERLNAILRDVGRRGKPGSTVIRALLEDRGHGVDRNATGLERRGLAVLRSGSLPDPALEYSIPWNPARRFDACYPQWHIAIEWDSRRWHLSDTAFEQDRERDRSALLHGWAVYRFTWHDVTERPDHVVETIRAAIERSARLA